MGRHVVGSQWCRSTPSGEQTMFAHTQGKFHGNMSLADQDEHRLKLDSRYFGAHDLQRGADQYRKCSCEFYVLFQKEVRGHANRKSNCLSREKIEVRKRTRPYQATASGRNHRKGHQEAARMLGGYFACELQVHGERRIKWENRKKGRTHGALF